ncbi:MAG TPA: helix-turn-helix transcriptional regulator [Candidatus Krumholzibacteria bacterium]|nr:helix-turn-helix transcriptional regulator [Candidatus Krumholzibacteria bacterium]
MPHPELRNRLKVLRAEHDWTQAELATRVGVSRKTINTIERGVFVPSTVLALRLARVFGVAVEEIFALADEVDGRGS